MRLVRGPCMSFGDLNVPWNEETKDRLPTLLGAIEKAGYRAVAVNHSVQGRLPRTKCPIAKIPSAALLRQYTRLTLILDDPQQNYGINSQNEIIRSYDLIAVQAETERMFQVACATLDIDIITFDLASGRLAYPIRHGYVRQAIQRGITFELCYSGCIRDTASRRNAIGNASIITRTIGQCCRRGGGLIISSGAEYPWMIRYPHDVINLAGLYGVPAHLRHQCLAVDAVVAHAGTRSLTYRGAVAIVESEDESKMPPPSSKRIKGDSKNGDFSQDFIKFF